MLRIINQTKEQKNHSDTKSKDLINIEDLDNLSKRERGKKKKEPQNKVSKILIVYSNDFKEKKKN